MYRYIRVDLFGDSLGQFDGILTEAMQHGFDIEVLYHVGKPAQTNIRERGFLGLPKTSVLSGSQRELVLRADQQSIEWFDATLHSLGITPVLSYNIREAVYTFLSKNYRCENENGIPFPVSSVGKIFNLYQDIRTNATTTVSTEQENAIEKKTFTRERWIYVPDPDGNFEELPYSHEFKPISPVAGRHPETYKREITTVEEQEDVEILVNVYYKALDARIWGDVTDVLTLKHEIEHILKMQRSDLIFRA